MALAWRRAGALPFVRPARDHAFRLARIALHWLSPGTRTPQYLWVYRALGLLYFATRSATAAVMRHQPNTAERGKGAGPLIGGPLSATPLLVQAWTNQENAKPGLILRSDSQ